MNGYIKLHRDIMDHWISKRGPADYRHAWEDLLMLANHESVKTVYGGELMTFERGTVYRSITELGSLWKWKRDKVRRFLILLEKDGMITRTSNTQGTVIKIANYDKWQRATIGPMPDLGKSTHTGDDATPYTTTTGSTIGPTGGSTIGPQTRRNKKEEEGKEITPPLPPSRGGRKKMRRLDDGSDDGDDYTAMLRKQLEEEMI